LLDADDLVGSGLGGGFTTGTPTGTSTGTSTGVLTGGYSGGLGVNTAATTTGLSIPTSTPLFSQTSSSDTAEEVPKSKTADTAVEGDSDVVIKSTAKDVSATLTKEQTSSLEQSALSEGVARAEKLKKSDK